MAKISGGGALEARLKKLASTQPATVSIGFLGDATYDGGKSVAMVAAINEFGAPSRGQPPRPFFRNMIAAKSADWPGLIGRVFADEGRENAAATLTIVGAAVQGQLVQSIKDLETPPLSPRTIARKKFQAAGGKPLIDTGFMLRNVRFRVDGT